MKIDSETVVPLGWVLSGLLAVLSVTVLGTFWVSSVNDRLARIEEKLGIQHVAETNLIESVYAKARKK